MELAREQPGKVNDHDTLLNVAVAASEQWIRENVRQVVDEEQGTGDRRISYARFDRFNGGYVAYGHPTVETHRRMAEQLISQMDTFHLFGVQGE